MELFITLLPLILGLTAWTLSCIGIFSRKYPLLHGLSWFSCACSLWFPLYSVLQWVKKEDLAAVIDCIGAYMLCASVLLLGNFVINLISALLHRKKQTPNTGCVS